MNSSRIFSNKGRWIVLLVVLLGAMIFVTAASAGTVGLKYVTGTGLPDTRGGMVLDSKYVWISGHGKGLWRAERCTGSGGQDYVGVGDSGSWDLWWYNTTGHDGYPDDPDGVGYYIYEAGKNDGAIFPGRVKYNPGSSSW